MKSTLVDFLPAIADNTDDDFLPAFITPGFAPGSAAEVYNILDDSVHSLCEQDFVFVVHSHDDEYFGFPAIEIRAEGISGGHELVWVTSSSGVAHLCHLLGLFSADDVRRDGDVKDEVPIGQFDLTDRLRKASKMSYR